MAIVLRAIKGSPLTNDELDGNFIDLDDRVQLLEGVSSDSDGGSPFGKAIDFIEQVDNTLIVHYTDTTQDGPFELSALNLNFRGEWEPLTFYFHYDVVTVNGSVYLVNVEHTSQASFDPGANNGGPPDYYGLLLTNPGNVLPLGGTFRQALTKKTSTNFDVEWSDPRLDTLFDVAIPSDGIDTGAALVFDGDVWVPGHEALEDLTDVTMPSGGPIDGEVLIFSGGEWTSGQTAIADLADVDYSSDTPASGDLLIYNGVSWEPDSLSPAQLRYPSVVALDTSGTVVLDPELGTVFSVTPTNNITLNASTAPAGAYITIIVTTSGTSSFNITPNTNFKSTGALATGTVSGKVFTMSFVGNGTRLNETSRTTAM